MAEYIDRQAAIEKIRYQGIYGSGYSDEEREDDVVDMIESIPAADVRPVVKSKWVKMKFFPDWECEKCGSVISGNTPDPWNHYHYCPNCGANMREEN